MCRILKSDGFDTIEAGNGLIAYQILSSDTQSVALVLLDIGMPVMNGYELLQKMNETDLIRSVPVIVTTGNEDEHVELRCLEQGASDFLKKPYNTELVRHRVRSLLRLWDNAAWINQLEIDQLTGIYSKEPFYRHAKEVLDQHPDTAYEMIYTDVDDFKMINARYGTEVGDELLKYLAELFKGVIGTDGVCGRIGADNFALLMKESPKGTQETAGNQTKQAFANAPVKDIQIKAGVYPITKRSLSLSDMCDRAKLAAASIKHQYGVYYAIYDHSMRERALRDHQLAGSMVEALEKEQFAVYLQPKHNTECGAVVGAEALVRWNHPELGFISPAEFIPLFERNGFVTKLDFYMWTEVCKILKQWIDQGIRPIPISVNASRADFSTPDLLEKIVQLVDSYGIPHSLLHFEVTESAYTDRPQQIIDAVSALRDLGFLIEMDDFGSGYSSLNMLSELPIDILKLDMRFMQSGNERIKGGKRNILSFIVSLSKWLQLPTVAEGVETKGEFELLKSMGCNMIQGYYFAKPMAACDFAAYMQAHLRAEQCPVSKAVQTVAVESEDNNENKPKVLIVEDIESNREIMKELLTPYYQVTCVENGKLACEYLHSHHEELSCILLDLLMPIMDGFQVLEVMRSNGMIHEVPVIITTETGSNSELRALHLGAESFVAKPYNPEILLHHVKKAVEEKSYWQMKREYDNKKLVLENKIYRDELTGLLNRLGLEKAFGLLGPNDPYTMILLDIDHSSEFNQAYGQTAGDALLQAVAKGLIQSVRPEDILARIGGDEFMLILRGMTDPKMAMDKCKRLCDAIHSLSIASLRASAGVVVMHPPVQFGEIFRTVDLALYKAKHETQDGCYLWNKQDALD